MAKASSSTSGNTPPSTPVTRPYPLLVAIFILLCFLGVLLVAEHKDLLKLDTSPRTTETKEEQSSSTSKSQPQELPRRLGMTSVSGLYLSARHASLHENDDIYAALAMLLAVKRQPNNPVILMEAMDATLLAGKVQESMIIAERLESMPPEIQEAMSDGMGMVSLMRVMDAISARRYGEAHERLNTLLASGKLPPFQQLLFTLVDAWALQGLGQTDEAIARFNSVRSVTDAEPFVEFQFALLAAQAGQNKAAEEALDRAVKMAPALPRRVAEIYANLLIHDNRKEEAQALLNDFWKQNRDIWLEKSEIQAVLDDAGTELLVPTAQAGIAELLYGASSLAHQQGDQALAYRFLQLALHLRPDFPIARVLLAAYYERDKRNLQAIDVYATVKEGTPFWKRAQMEWAQMKAREGDIEEALSHLRKVSDRYPDSALPWLHRGDILRQEDRFEEAAKAYSNALERLSESHEYHWPVYYMRGICYERSKQWDKAEPDFKKALELSPNNPDVMNYLAYSWLDMGKNIEEAKTMLMQAVIARPQEGQIVDSMGWAFFKIGEIEHAYRFLERAVELLPNDPVVNDHLGDAYWKLGREREARFQWERSLKNKPDADLKKKLDQKIEKGLQE